MSYSVYVNESYVGPVGSSAQWDRFIDWADTLDLASYEKIVKLAEHSIISRPAELRAQLEEARKNDDVPSGLNALVGRLIAASKEIGDEPDDESALVVTDGANGVINAIVPADDKDHAEPADEED